jgi:glycosyltransferase involved in cell wall biosynthesis
VADRFVARDERVRVVRNPRNLGLADNWNRCVELARGPWIKFLFQDDYLAPTCLAVMLAHAGPATPFVVTARHLDFAPDTTPNIRNDYETHLERDLIRHRADWSTIVTAEQFAECLIDRPVMNLIGEPTVTLIHRSLFDRFGSFNVDMRILVDWEYFARIGVNTGLAFIKEPLATFRVHGGSTTQRESRRSKFTIELDSLVMLHQLAYHGDFEPARVIAGRRRPPVNLAHALASSVRDARRKIRAGREFDDQARPGFEALLQRLPGLTVTPPGYARRRLRELRWACVARVERVLGCRIRRGRR